jgi:hypothetical protein
MLARSSKAIICSPYIPSDKPPVRTRRTLVHPRRRLVLAAAVASMHSTGLLDGTRLTGPGSGPARTGFSLILALDDRFHERRFASAAGLGLQTNLRSRDRRASNHTPVLHPHRWRGPCWHRSTPPSSEDRQPRRSGPGYEGGGPGTKAPVRHSGIANEIIQDEVGRERRRGPGARPRQGIGPGWADNPNRWVLSRACASSTGASIGAAKEIASLWVSPCHQKPRDEGPLAVTAKAEWRGLASQSMVAPSERRHTSRRTRRGF